ncbi:MAG: protoporphyrinogen oxidase [Terriglobales bacterium]
MTRVAIIGGGIAGLSAAHYLTQAGADFLLFEAGPRLGGVIQTERTPEGFIVEAGPDSFLSAKPWAAELAREVGLGEDLIPSNDHERKTYILHSGKLVAIPDGMQMMVPTRSWPVLTSPLFSFATKLRMAREFLAPPAALAENADESVASFVSRHFGQEVVERLADPLLAGVYGGDSGRLSARAVLPQMVASEAAHRSLVRGALHARASGNSPQSIFTSLSNGMGQLIDALAARIPAENLRLKTPVNSLIRTDTGWEVGTESFSEVILAVPAPAAATLLWPLDPALSALLGKVSYTSSITVALGYEELSLPPGFGLLVPRAEGKRMIACTFVHRKFKHRSPPGRALLRVFLTSGLEENDAALSQIVRVELRSILNITAPPIMTRICRWPSAMPQYGVGHLDRVAQMEARAAGLPGLYLIGNAYRGVGIPDCVRSGKLAAEKISATR